MNPCPVSNGTGQIIVDAQATTSEDSLTIFADVEPCPWCSCGSRTVGRHVMGCKVSYERDKLLSSVTASTTPVDNNNAMTHDRADHRKYLVRAMQMITEQCRWARTFPQPSLDRIAYIAECVAFDRPLPPNDKVSDGCRPRAHDGTKTI